MKMKTSSVTIDTSPIQTTIHKNWARRAGVSFEELLQTLLLGALEIHRSGKTPKPEDLDIALIAEYRRILNLKPRAQDVYIGPALKVWDLVYRLGKRFLQSAKKVWRFVRLKRT